MSDSKSEELEGWQGCLGSLILIPLLIVFLQWLWGVTVKIAIWLWLAPGRLLAWTLSWPFFSGHLLVGILALVVCGLAILLLVELLLSWSWPRRFPHASGRASSALQGKIFRRDREVIRFEDVAFCDPGASTANVRFFRCQPRSRRSHPDQGIVLKELMLNDLSIEPDQCRISRRLRKLRLPTRTYLESLRREGLELLPGDSIEAKAWQAVLDSVDELNRLDELHQKAHDLLSDASRVMRFRSDNELLSPVRERSQALIPKLTADIEKIDERSLALRRFGYKLYEFLNVPASLRSADLSEDMEASLLAQRGASDELFDEIRLIEQSYGDLLGPS